MYNQNYGQGTTYQQNYGGYGYAQMKPMPKMTQPLTKEQINALRKNKAGFSLEIKPEEFLKAKCTHKDPDTGDLALIDNHDGTGTCSICGSIVPIGKFSREQVVDIVEQAKGVINNLKTFYLTMPESYLENIAPVSPILDKLPDLIQLAYEDYTRYENPGSNISQRGNAYGEQLLNQVMGPQQYGYAQPQYQQPYVQPQQYQQQYAQPQYQQPYVQQQQYQQPYVQPADNNTQQSNAFGYAGAAQQQPQYAQPQQQAQQNVEGGKGMPYTKDNATPSNAPETTKVYQN